MSRHDLLTELVESHTLTHSFLSFVRLLIKGIDKFSQLSDSDVCGGLALCFTKFFCDFFQQTGVVFVNCVLVSHGLRQPVQFGEFVFKPIN